MSHVSLLPSADPHGHSSTRIGEAGVRAIENVRCALCGTSLLGERERYRLVSPLVSMGRVTVCSICRRAALGQGYRPAS